MTPTMTSVAATAAPPQGASAPSLSPSPSPSPGRHCTATTSSSSLAKQQPQQRPTRRQRSREHSAISIRQNVVAAAHAVYVAGHNAKERVKHALPTIARRNTGDSISSSSASSGGGGGVYPYPNNALSDTEEERPNSWPRITPRAPRIGDATDAALSSSSSFSMSDCSNNSNSNNSRSRRSRVSTRDIRKFIKSFPPTTPTLSSVDETLEAAYPCALARSLDNTLWHGQLFLTTHRLLFAVSAAAAEQQFKNVEVDYTDVVSVEKTVTGAIWPNALKVIVSGSGETRKELLFAAFVGRDAAFCDLMIMRRNRRITVEEEQRSGGAGAGAAGKRPLRVTFKVDETTDDPAVPHHSGGVAAVVHDHEARDPHAEAPPPPPLLRPKSDDDDISSSSLSGTPSPSPVSLALANTYTRNPTTLAKPNPATPLIPTASLPPPPPQAAAQPSSPVATLKHLFLFLLPRNLLPNLSFSSKLFSPTREQLALATILFSLAVILLLGLVTAAVNVSRLAALTQRIDRAAALASAAAAAAAAAGGGGRVS
ncbi:hypothetical protein HDU89_008251 [Geranomyces variabilis]|nr:hypothetical protein HDU89_008251 [Geranomyces variabilis]